MKITIAPSEPASKLPTITLEVPADNLTALEIQQKLVIPALLALGVNPTSLAKLSTD